MYPLTIDIILFQFFLFSFLGWILEFLYRTLRYGKLINPGFNRGPYVPLYGLAAAFLTMTYSLISGYSLYPRALVYLIITTAMELLTGWLLLVLFNKRYWDYRKNFRNFKGLICPSFSLAWVACCFFFELLLYPLSMEIEGAMPLYAVRIMNVFFLLILTTDFAFSSGLVQLGRTMIRTYAPAISDRIEPAIMQLEEMLTVKNALQLAPRRILDIINTMPNAKQLARQYRKQARELRGRFNRYDSADFINYLFNRKQQ